MTLAPGLNKLGHMSTRRFALLLGLFFILGIEGGIQCIPDFQHLGLQLGDALGLAGVGLAPFFRGTLEGLQVGIGGGGHGFHPRPTFAAHLVGNACQLVLRQPVY